MEENQLIHGENIISKTNGNLITLTNRRIRYYDKVFGRANITSILLCSISSIGVKYRSKLIFIILAVISIAGGIIGAMEEQELIFIGLGGALLFVILYFLSRRHFLSIRSKGGDSIMLLSRGMKKTNLTTFIDQIEEAMLNSDK